MFEWLKRLFGKEPWKHMVNYAIRNIDVGDEEEYRLIENPDYFLVGFKEEGVPDDTCSRIRVLIYRAKSAGFPDYDACFAEIHGLLKPYMSHRKLYEEDWDRWEFQTWTDEEEWNTYEEWKDA